MESLSTLLKFQLADYGVAYSTTAPNTSDFHVLGLLALLLLIFVAITIICISFHYLCSLLRHKGIFVGANVSQQNTSLINVGKIAIIAAFTLVVFALVFCCINVANAQETNNNKNVPTEANMIIDEVNKTITSSGLNISNNDSETDLLICSVTLSSNEEQFNNSSWKLSSEIQDIYNAEINKKIEFAEPITVSPKELSNLSLSTDLDINIAKQFVGTCPVVIGYEIYQDFNVHGILRDANGELLTNYPVKLLDDNAKTILSSSTDNFGKFTFTNIDKNMAL